MKYSGKTWLIMIITIIGLGGCRTSNKGIIQELVNGENLTFGRKTLLGRVISVESASIEGAVVRIESGLLEEEVHTNKAGFFSFENLPLNEYDLTVFADGYGLWGGEVNTAQVSWQEINLSPLGFLSPNSITGKVVDKDTKSPIAGATIRWGIKNVVSNAGGVFALSGVEAVGGNVNFRILAENYANESVDIPLAPGSSTVNVKVELSRLSGNAIFTFYSTVTSGTVGGVDLKLINPNDEVTYTGIANSEGRLGITGVRTGNYDLYLSASGYEWQQSNIVVESGANEFALEMVPKSGSIIGKVNDRDTGAGLANAFVRVEGGSSNNYAFTSGDGSFEIFSVLPGTYFLEFIHGNYDNPTPRKAITLPVGTEVIDGGTYTLISVHGSATIRLIVTINDGTNVNPLPADAYYSRDLAVQLSRMHGEIELPVNLDSNIYQGLGELEITELPPGHYKLGLWYADTSREASSIGGTTTGIYKGDIEMTLGAGTSFEGLLNLAR